MSAFSALSHYRENSVFPGLFLFALLGGGCITPTDARAQKEGKTVLLEAGTVLPVRLNDSLNSRDARKGDAFSARLHASGKNNYSGLPAGTIVEGTVREARRQRGEEPGMLDLDFHRVRIPNGRSFPIQGSLIGLDARSVTRMSDGRLIAKVAHRNDRSAYIGYGAGIGLIAGLFRKRPLEDTLLGAGLGYLLGATQRTRTEPRDVVLKEGAELGVRLDGRFRYADIERESEDERIDMSELEDEPFDDFESEISNRGSEREVIAPSKATHIGVLLDDEEVVFDRQARPAVVAGKIMLPVTEVLRTARIRMRQDQDRAGESLTVLGEIETIQINAGSRVALIDGTKRVRLLVPVRRLHGTLYAPLQFFEIVFRQKIDWDAATHTVLLSTGSSEDKEQDLP